MAEMQKKSVSASISGLLAYVKIKKPAKKFESDDVEFSINIITDKATGKAWNKEFPKQKAKEFEPSEFEAKFKMPAPFDDNEVYVIKIGQDHTKNGERKNPIFDPKVYHDTGGKTKDGKRILEDVSDKEVGNGSTGTVTYNIVENSFGKFAKLKSVCLDEDGFIEYKSGYEEGSEYGAVVMKKAVQEPSEEQEQEEPPASPTKPAKATSEKKVKKVVSSEDEDDIPW